MLRESRMETAFIVKQRHKIKKMPLQLGKDYKATIRNVCVQSATWWNEHEIQCQDFQQLRISQGSTRKLHRLVLLFEVASSQKACVLPKSSLDIQNMTWPLARAWDRDRIAHLACSALSFIFDSITCTRTYRDTLAVSFRHIASHCSPENRRDIRVSQYTVRQANSINDIKCKWSGQNAAARTLELVSSPCTLHCCRVLVQFLHHGGWR